MERKVIEAKIENLDLATGFIEEILERHGCSFKTQLQVKLAAEEIFVNVSSYAYGDKSGSVEITCELKKDPFRAVISFADKGVPFDPLKHDDPDLSLDATLNREGGLGIFLVKNTMDDVSYRYQDGRNILTIVKNIG